MANPLLRAVAKRVALTDIPNDLRYGNPQGLPQAEIARGPYGWQAVGPVQDKSPSNLELPPAPAPAPDMEMRDALAPQAHEGDGFFAAIGKRLFGGPGIQDSNVDALAKGLSNEDIRDAALREQVARRTLESEQFDKEGSSGLRRILLGAAIGSKAGLDAPYGAGGVGVGITAGLQGVKGVSENEASLSKGKRESASDALAKLMANEKSKGEFNLKSEVDKSEAVAKLSSNVEKIRPNIGKDGPLRPNEFRVLVNGDWSAVTPKADSALWRFLASKGESTDKTEQDLLKQWNILFQAEKAPKTGQDEASLADTIARRQELEGILQGMNPKKYAYFTSQKKMTPEQLSGPSGVESVIKRMSGVSLRPQAESATNGDLERMYKTPPGSFDALTPFQRANLRNTNVSAEKRQVLLDYYLGK